MYKIIKLKSSCLLKKSVVCIYACVFMQVQMLMCMSGGWRLTLNVFLNCLHFIRWNSVSHLSPELTSLASLANQLALRIPCLWSWAGVQLGCHSHSSICMGSGDPKFGLCIYMVIYPLRHLPGSSGHKSAFQLQDPWSQPPWCHSDDWSPWRLPCTTRTPIQVSVLWNIG